MIGALYSTVGIVMAVSYLPQVIRLIKAQTPCHEISMASWVIWNYTASVSLLYSIYDLNDTKLTIVNIINVLFINLIIGVTLYKRRKYGDLVVISDQDDSLTQIYNTVEEVEEVMDSEQSA